MTIDASSPIGAPEGTALLPARPFGETSTLTFPRGSRAAGRRDMAARIADATTAHAAAPERVAVVPADPTPLTITL